MTDKSQVFSQGSADGFDAWFDGHFLDPDGGSGHLPSWLKGDLRLAWDAALANSVRSPAEISTFNDTMPSSLNDACRRLDLAQEEIMKLRAQVDSAAAWLDQEITRAADQQRQSYARSGEHGQRQGERWHARQIALYEAKLKLTSTGGQK
jgi:hypothetical protein